MPGLTSSTAGSLILDGTCGGGGHTEAILQAGADVLALDQDPDALEFASARLTNFGRRVTLPASWAFGVRRLGGLVLILATLQIVGAVLGGLTNGSRGAATGC